MIDQHTICAIATAPGGALGIIRISGTKTFDIVSKIFDKNIFQQSPNTILFGRIIDANKNTIDEVLLSKFCAPHSYTGEDSCEISCHGSSFIMQKLIELLIENGCRMAKHGEFTQRAFLNGKLDLSQAEAVADLIASQSESAHIIAMKQMKGDFSHSLKLLRDKLLEITSLLELELDFSDHEDLEFADRNELKKILQEIQKTFTSLTNSFKLGNAIKNGIPVAIIGKTNAGKSTLLNALTKEDRAIVSNIHGTTRDTIEELVNINGLSFRFIDTAGIRETNDEIEQLGIKRSLDEIKKASLILWVIDSKETTIIDIEEELSKNQIPRSTPLFIIMNKTDLLNANEYRKAEYHLEQLKQHYPSLQKIIPVSAKEDKGIDKIEQFLAEQFSIAIEENTTIISNARHFEALKRANTSALLAQHSMDANYSGELISIDLKECIHSLSEILGDITTQDILNNIFKNFCIGK